MTSSLPTLPIELAYRVLDNLRPVDILYSLWDVSTRLNAIISSYRPYQVKLYFTSAINYSSILPHIILFDCFLLAESDPKRSKTSFSRRSYTLYKSHLITFTSIRKMMRQSISYFILSFSQEFTSLDLRLARLGAGKLQWLTQVLQKNTVRSNSL